MNPLTWLSGLADHLKAHAKDWAVFVSILIYAYNGIYRSAAEMDSSGKILFEILGVVGLVHGGKTIAATVWGNGNGNGHAADPVKPADDPVKPVGE